MIKPGWKRDVCPQCHMPGRVGERFEKALNKSSNIGNPQVIAAKIASFVMIRFNGPETLPIALDVDVCDNCGVVYAYKCSAGGPNATSTD